MSKEQKQSNFRRTMVIIGVLIIPLMYSYFYLKAFWDPYSKLDSLPVAVVNEDKGAEINSVQRNLGKELQDKMEDSNELGFKFVDAKEADEGLANGKYYATIIIPEEFSKNISSASEENKTTAQLIYSPNEKTNYLATQILNRAILELSDQVKENVDGEVVGTLTDKLNEVPNQLNQVSDGVNQLYDGASKLNDGTEALQDGTENLSSNYTKFNSVISELRTGTTSLSDGSKKLDSGIDGALAGTRNLNEATKDIAKIHEGTQALVAGSKSLDNNEKTYVAGVNAYIDSVNAKTTALSTSVQTYLTANPTAMADPHVQYLLGQINTLKPSTAEATQTQYLRGSGDRLVTEGTTALKDGIAELDSKTTDLYKVNIGANDLQSGLEKIKAGSTTLVAGTSKLDLGAAQIGTASSQILNGINQLNSGSEKLADGSSELKSGIKEASDKIGDGITSATSELSKLNGLSNFVKNPVEVDQESENSVPNYGTAFAPYFMSLSLWVGGLIIFVGIYLDADEKFKILSRHSDRKVVRTAIYFLIAIAQAILLAVIVHGVLKLTLVHPVMYYLACILVSVVFMSIIQFFMVNFKDAGKFVVILLLILQLTACGGTFPMELVPKLFNVLYPVMPMTYSVRLFKEAISGGNTALMVNSIVVLISIFVVFATATIAIALMKKKNGEETETKNSKDTQKA